MLSTPVAALLLVVLVLKGSVCMVGVQVIESTGVVVTPYMEYPQLLGMLLQMLSEGSPQARLEVLKVCLGSVWGRLGLGQG